MVQGEPGCVPSSMYPVDPGTVLARSCLQRGVDKKIWDASQSEIMQTRRLRLAGHVLRLPDVRPARVAMTWIPESGRRTSGRPVTDDLADVI